MAKKRVLTHCARENTCPHPVQKSKTKFKWQITELHTHTTLVRLVPSRHHTRIREAPKDAHHRGNQGLQDADFRRGNQQRHWKQDPFELLSWGTGRQAEAAARRLCEICCSELPSSFLNSRYCTRVSWGRGIPNWVFQLHDTGCNK